MIADFNHFRIIPWHPRFHWEKDTVEAGRRINVFHEDYPDYVEPTVALLQDHVKNYDNNGRVPLRMDTLDMINDATIQNVHHLIFGRDKENTYRTCNVRVGNHVPPDYSLVPKLMEQLHFRYRVKRFTLGNLLKWYVDFETIHPFLDGNGRVGGAIVAMLSFNCFPSRGHLTPGQ